MTDAIPRRTVLVAATAGLAGALVARDVRTAHADVPAHDPFGLGVASGDPLPQSVILWTRLVAPDPTAATPYAPRSVEVEWEVARDEAFGQVVQRGTAWAHRDLAHSVHVDVGGLQPGTDYHYRFRVGGHVSPAGRTRTAPALGSLPAATRWAVVNCQDWQNGYWPTFTGLAQEDLDVVLHVGDYIYEYDPASAFPDRRHTTPDVLGLDQLRTLGDYRARHAQYKTDPALQAAHLAFPWIVAWDDHETENNYAGLVDEVDDTGARHQDPAEFARQRAAAYQAYYEHMPIRPKLRKDAGSYKIYRGFEFGRLARLDILDTRQYRTDQPGGHPSDFGPDADGRGNAAGTMTGPEQEAWLLRRLRHSGAVWDVVAQQTLMSPIRFPDFLGSGQPFIRNLDQWDGYQPQRARLLQALVDEQVRNPVVLSGDIHSTWLSDLHLRQDDPTSPVVATEFCSTSISSSFPAAFDPVLKAWNPGANPHVKYFDGSRHGYLRLDITAERCRVDVRTVPTIATRVAPVTTSASYATEAGSPGVVPA
ncbi:alkaline phosphatase D [Motilibacter rhizosphaerae]|uniref:Alkaline phosphatase D n=1 Tax=Motilibacter rhizosphaerae TaxID=598652 RepID=A0A4Q7NH80_9ACTN|nr:alkaline phosphatase D family protein [Motilibacter rhizosphaerae]RZS82806.1 alkaline phosphatase D [Motilibacter rhizosphaerae]